MPTPIPQLMIQQATKTNKLTILNFLCECMQVVLNGIPMDIQPNKQMYKTSKIYGIHLKVGLVFTSFEMVKSHFKGKGHIKK